MYEVFEHTADVGLRVRAKDLDELFADAGRGLFSLMLENPDAVMPRTSVQIELTAGNLEDLFFDWLAELLYAFHSRKLALCRFEVRLTGLKLHALVSGEPIDPARHQLAQEVKAITYHGLAVRQTGDHWLAEVIVDL